MEKFSDQLERWLLADGPHTLGGLTELFQEKAFAVSFILLMSVPALPLPTGGATHVLEIVTILIAVQLVAGRRMVWLPERWKRLELSGPSQRRFTLRLLKLIRRVEGFSHPRLRRLVRHRVTGFVFGVVVIALSLTAFVAPPFSGLDTLPALGVVLVSLAVLLEDIALAIAGLIVGAIGALLVLVLGSVAVEFVQDLF